MSSSKKKMKKKEEGIKEEPLPTELRIKASIPITVTAKVKKSLSELKASDEHSKVHIESVQYTSKRELKPDKYGLHVEKDREKICLALNIPSAPVSLVAPNQKMQGEIRYSSRIRILATRLQQRKGMR